MYLYDYHMHSNNSIDGRNTISEMCAKSIALGLKEIAVTDHFEPCLEDVKCSSYKPEKYFKEMNEASLLYGKEIKIKYAVELGQPHIYPENSLRLIETRPYDYILASVHRLRNNEDFGLIAYSKENVYSYCIKYLNEMKSLVQWNNFNCIGHFDLVKRYASKYNLSLRFMNYQERVEEILKIIIRNGKGIEVNTSGLRQSAGECLPNFDIISFYKELGGEIITVGSDAHNTEDVGKGIQEAIEMICLAGFSYMTVFTNRKPAMIKLPGKTSIYQINKQSA